MSHSLDLPDHIYAALEQAAAASGTTPVQWIASRLPSPVAESDNRSLAERFAGRTGRIASGQGEPLSEDCGNKFADYLEEKRKAGRL